ncbi:MAG: hypothetical protein GY927_00865 [bacterium]|nr:hypothetical protein [bacterium]
MSTEPPDWQKANKGRAQAAYGKALKARESLENKKPEQMERKASDMVKNKKPTPILAPKGSARNAVDSQIHGQRLATEKRQEAARQKAAGLSKDWQISNQKQKQLELNKGKNKGEMER